VNERRLLLERASDTRTRWPGPRDGLAVARGGTHDAASGSAEVLQDGVDDGTLGRTQLADEVHVDGVPARPVVRERDAQLRGRRDAPQKCGTMKASGVST
jgi:hypothetical protein